MLTASLVFGYLGIKTYEKFRSKDSKYSLSSAIGVGTLFNVAGLSGIGLGY